MSTDKMNTTGDPLQAGPMTSETPPSLGSVTNDTGDGGGYDPEAAQAAVDAQMAELRQNAAKAVDAYADDPPDVDDPDEVVPDDEPPVDAAPADEVTPDDEPLASDETVAVLKREKQLRDDRAALQLERAEFEREKALLDLQLKADPLGFLKSRGVEINDSFAEEAVNETLGDLAPDTYRQTQEARRLARENAEYKARLEALERQSVESEYQQYQNNLVNAVNEVSAEKYPAFARVAEVYGSDSAVQMAWQTAQRYAQAGVVATPEQILGQLDQQYAPLVGARPEPQPPVENTAPPKPKRGRSKSLRNNMQQSSVPPKPIEEMTPEEQQKVWRANATRAFNEAVAKGL